MARPYSRNQPFDHSTNRSPRASDYIGVRLGVELRARAIQAADALGIPLSEWFRLIVAQAIDSGNLAGGDPQNAGYLHGRQLGLAIAQQQVTEALRAVSANVPMSLEEANARGMIPPEGYVNGTNGY